MTAASFSAGPALRQRFRTLALLPGATAIGCAYAAQEMAEVPAGPEDWRLDAIATEAGVIRIA